MFRPVPQEGAAAFSAAPGSRPAPPPRRRRRQAPRPAAAGPRGPRRPPAGPAEWSSSPESRCGPSLHHIGRSRGTGPGPTGRPPGTTALPAAPPNQPRQPDLPGPPQEAVPPAERWPQPLRHPQKRRLFPRPAAQPPFHPGAQQCQAHGENQGFPGVPGVIDPHPGVIDHQVPDPGQPQQRPPLDSGGDQQLAVQVLPGPGVQGHVAVPGRVGRQHVADP